MFCTKNDQKISTEMNAHRKEINDRFSDVYEYIRRLKSKKFELLTIGDDTMGGTVQVRTRALQDQHDINSWLTRSIDKIASVSWVQLEITGRDHDGDYFNCKFEFHKDVGKALLQLCAEAPENETLFHHILTTECLSN